MTLRMRRHLGAAVGQLAFEPVPMRLRAYVGDALALDTAHGALVWEPRRIVPVYAVPERDLAGAVGATDPQPPPPDPVGLPPFLGPDTFEPHTTPGRCST